MGSSSNKRKYPRLKSPLIARFRLHRDKNPAVADDWNIVSIRNISAGGLSFSCRSDIPAGTVLEFILELSFSIANIRCLAVVQRAADKTAGEGILRRKPLYGIAVKFIGIDSRQRKVIDRIVEEFNKNAHN